MDITGASLRHHTAPRKDKGMKRLTLVVDGNDIDQVMDTVAEAADQGMLVEPSGADKTDEGRLSWRWVTDPTPDADRWEDLTTNAGEQLPRLATIRAYRILPQDIVWGIEHDGGFHITKPFTCDKGALPVDGGRVNLGPIEVTGGRLMLVEVR